MESNENVLLIMPDFYDYSMAITTELKKRGYNVDLFFEEPPRMVFLAIRKLSKLLKIDFYQAFNNYLFYKVNKTRKKYSVLLIIRGNILNKEFVNKIKRTVLIPNAKTIYYTWDSFEYLNHKGEIGTLLSKRYTFDSCDAKDNPEWGLLPLFYTEAFDDKNQPINIEKQYRYDVACIASFNEFRYKSLMDFIQNNPNLNVFIKLYIGKSLYLYKKKNDEFYQNVDNRYLMFEPISSDELMDIYRHSKTVIDITDEKQSGLSMRTIEMIGLQKKLITNNRYVKNYDFYSRNNVFVLENTELPVVNELWLNLPYDTDTSKKHNYSLQHWIDVILS